MIRAAVLICACAALSPAWVESVEFPWNTCPKPLWERQLVWLKNIGITHVSLPPAHDVSQLTDLIRIIRMLGLEADLEGPVPDVLQPLTRAHGGPLTEPLPGAARISALSGTALTQSREQLLAGAAALVWTDVEETLGPVGYRPGAVSFALEERPAAIPLRRSAQISAYWSKTFPSLHALAGVGVQLSAESPVVPGPSVRQFAAESGISVVSVVNKSAKPWTGELKVFYGPAKRQIGVPGVSVPGKDSVWLPVNVPLTAGPLCKDCSAFGNPDHLIYATAEMTAMEYENGILAMEFAAPSGGEVMLQLSREPYGPFVAGGRPTSFDWDEQAQRARLKIPPGKGAGGRVRIGLAIEPPDQTGFFDNARVLMIGETNHLTAQFSSDAIAQRSRLRLAPAFPAEQQSGKEPLTLTYDVKVPATAIHGDYADLALEADGTQMSHAHPQLLRPVMLQFPDAIDVHLAANSALPLFPATVSLNQRAGRDLIVTVRNNAPEIRNFELEPKAEGLEFSPAKMQVTVGVSTSRDVSFRVFAKDAAPGLHTGSIAVTGATTATEPIQFAVYPAGGAVAFSTGGFSLIESAKYRASFLPGRWLEFINKENNQNLLMSTGTPFTAGSIDTAGDALVFGENRRTVKLAELEDLATKPKR
ncbi:MAG TPA: hypothetical protein VK789_00900 [Bryobacteraceae bacterium]|nr:hypothetical protein [Bryobacteraceae bacterium]